MGQIVVTEFVTLDGVAEDPGGAEGSAGGGWSFQFDRGEEGDQFKYDEMLASDAHLLGRNTYQAFAEAWPSRTGDFADRFNSAAQVRRLQDPRQGRLGRDDDRARRPLHRGRPASAAPRP